MISKILVPTDGSKTAHKAVNYALGLVKQTGATLTLLSIIDTSAFITKSIPAVVSPTHIMEPIENYLRLVAETYLKEAEKLCKKKRIKTKAVIRTGHTVEEIIKEAKKSKVDLIVMGSHGKSALKSAVLGSVTYGVIHKNTTFPVLVIRK